MSQEQPSERQPIEAHQIALVTSAFALDLDWDGEQPTVKTTNRWPSFSDQLHEDDLQNKKRQVLDAEQVYFQAFVMERCLDSVHTTTAGLANVLFDAWNHYLRTLPSIHGVAFDYDLWLRRKQEYTEAWNDLGEKLAGSPRLPQNPYYHLAMFLFERICGLSPWDQGPVLVGMITAEKVQPFIRASEKWIADAP